MLNSFHISAIAAFLINIGLGVTIFSMNPERRANRIFLVSALGLAAWLSCFALVPIAHTKEQVLFLMQQSGTASGIIPLVFDLLRDAIVNEKERPRRLLLSITPFCIAFVLTTIISNHPTFIIDIDTTHMGFPMPIYGAAQYAYVSVIGSSISILVWRFARDLRNTKGIKREELGFCVLAALMMIFLGLGLAQIVPNLTGNRHVMQFLPLCVVMYDVVLAYGIVTRRIMSVSEVLRRATAYLLISVYMAGVYAIIYWPTAILLRDVGMQSNTLPHFLAALAMAFSIAPAHGRMQRIANRLFINLHTMDVQEAIRKAQSIMNSIGTMDQLLENFARFVCMETGTDRATVLLKKDNLYVQQFPVAAPPTMIDSADGLIQVLHEERGPVSVDLLKRSRPTPDREKANATLSRLQAALAVGIIVNERLDGILLLATRVSGKIYGVNELNALQIICNQLGTSLENSRLYTALQDGKIYNDILVDSLVSGVIAVDANQKISVFNRQAQILTGIGAAAALNKNMECLPGAIVEAIRHTLDTRESIRDKDEVLGIGSKNETPVRLSSSVFHGTSGDILGAIVLLNDMRTVKQMEAQIRRSDRLSSIGTLAAGMAHEIKNPLVPIKTFTQLLPQQYEDPEFRRTFSDLVLREVGRIDSIVTRLLHFARPAPATLAPTALGEILRDALKLLEQQIRNRGILMETRFAADHDMIMGDKDLLSQAFVNFILNAIEAMDKGGTLTITTSVIETEGRRYLPGVHIARQLIRVDIEDTGSGIDPHNLANIFDPFFTTKSNGTGMGLSVSHGIIEEHGASVNVESHPPDGTTFHLLFELIEAKDLQVESC